MLWFFSRLNTVDKWEIDDECSFHCQVFKVKKSLIESFSSGASEDSRLEPWCSCVLGSPGEGGGLPKQGSDGTD
ncbi:hypothetical protein Ancab_024126 [Ancistrocladus abbreviatus]